MMLRSCQLLLVAGSLVRLCTAQSSGWTATQNSTTMCFWTTPRAAIVRDTVYIDGGDLYWSPGYTDGTIGPPQSDDNPLGLVYKLNFSQPFNTSENISTVFTTLSKANGATANNIGPNYSDGGMFANDYEWFIFGGMVQKTDAYVAQDADVVSAFEVYSQGATKNTVGGFMNVKLPNTVNRYITDGAAVSVPSENLGFYFGGLRQASFGPIYEISGNKSENPDTLSTTLIQLNMTVQQSETWNNFTLVNVSSRVNAELVWIPVADEGVLIAIGGVIDPAFATLGLADNSTQIADSKATSPKFMTTVAVYDISTGLWYEQDTSGTAPGQLTQGCTVVASAPDGKSHNIYWYGGFDGIDLVENFSDDVYVLSVPSFVWAKVYNGTSTHARAGHKCVKPYPDQMFVIGGYAAAGDGANPPCVGGNIIQMYNLSSNTWIDSYNPTKWSNYTVPTAVSSAIGTATSPSGGFSNDTLATLFKTSYNTTKIVNWYPYQLAATSAAPNTTTIPTPVPKSGTPSYLGPVLGVVLGLIFISLVILGFVLYRRRHLLSSRAAESEAGTMDNRRWVTSWLRSTPVDVKAPPTVTTDDTPMTPYEEEMPLPNVPEMGEGQLHEMADTSMPSELHATNTGFIPLKHSTNGHSHSNGAHRSQSTTSNRSQSSGVSGVSRNSIPSNPSQRPGISPLPTPPLAAGTEADRARFASGVSNVSESDRGHLRGISETSVSTDGVYETPGGMSELGAGAGAGAGATPGGGRLGGLVSPLSPPLGSTEQTDYLSAGDAAARRRSNFQEGLEEVEEKK